MAFLHRPSDCIKRPTTNIPCFLKGPVLDWTELGQPWAPGLGRTWAALGPSRLGQREKLQEPACLSQTGLTALLIAGKVDGLPDLCFSDAITQPIIVPPH